MNGITFWHVTTAIWYYQNHLDRVVEGLLFLAQRKIVPTKSILSKVDYSRK